MSDRKTDLMWCIDCDKFPCKEIMDENGVMRASGCFCYDSMEKGEHTDELKKQEKKGRTE